MKKTFTTCALIAAAGLLGAVLTTGCTSVPGYSGDERGAQIGRNMAFDGEQFADDVDTVLLLRPSDSMTQWNVWHRQ